MTADRLTEIKARVASFRRDGLGYSGTSMADLEYALGAIERAYAAGWRMAAIWAERDDLLADIGSPAYLKDMRAALEDKP